MILHVSPRVWFFATAIALLQPLAATGQIQGPASHAYETMAGDPDPGDFVRRAGTGLTLLGMPIRLAGTDAAWLGLREDASGVRRPTEYEVTDALATVRAMGGSVVRSTTLAASVGCPLCLSPSQGSFSDDAFRQTDMAIKHARDLGLKLILPLAGGGHDCGAPAARDAPYGSACTFVRWRGLIDGNAFFTDPQIRQDFLAYVATILQHVNGLTGVAYRNDPTILAWENCDSCGADADPAIVGPWVEAVGQAIRALDKYHLYENGALAGRIGAHARQPAPQAALAPPTVDIVGDRLVAAERAGRTARDASTEAVAAVDKAGVAYVVDVFGWGAADWKTVDDLSGFLRTADEQRAIDGLLVGGLQAHADTGGFLPETTPAPGQTALPALYFPGTTTPSMSEADMQQRARALRRFAYGMADIRPSPAFQQPDPPVILAVTNGRISWRGAAGAAAYSIERSTDPLSLNSWQLICDLCVTDRNSPWQDPNPPKGKVWYRIAPANANAHVAGRSDAVESR